MKDSEDFAKFYEAYESKVRGLLFRLAGESHLADLIQETFLKAWESRSRFRNESRPSTWIYRIAYNSAVDFLRKKKDSVSAKTTDVEYDSQIENELSNKELAEGALQVLSLEQRAVVVLFYFDELKLEEIAATLQIPLGTVKSRISSAKLKMNEFLKQKGVHL